jgi:DNA-binding transcriptional regulator GbsR (MarR family)
MSDQNKNNQKNRFIEDLSVKMEEMGLPRMAGKIQAALLISDTPHLTAKELAEIVGGSKGAINTMTHLMLRFSIIEKFTIPGKRSTYFRLKDNYMIEMIKHKIKTIKSYRETLEFGMIIVEDQSPEIKERLRKSCELNKFMTIELENILKKLVVFYDKK